MSRYPRPSFFSRLSRTFDAAAQRVVGSAAGEAEANGAKLELVRIALGLILAWRTFFIARDSGWYFEPSEWLGVVAVWQAVAGWILFALAILLVVGVATRPVALTLMVTQAVFGAWTSTYNLGPMLAIPMLGGIGVLATRSRWSVDALLLNRPRVLPEMVSFRRIGLIIFLFYAILNFTALLFHLEDAYWIAGKTTGVMLTNSYLSRFYGFFRAWETGFPSIYALFSISGGVFQTIFQLGMIPLVLTRWGRWFVVGYGAIFVGMSLCCLQLSILPALECVLWFWIFVPASIIPEWMRKGFAGRSVDADSTGGASLTKWFCGAFGIIFLAFMVSSISGHLGWGWTPRWLTTAFYHAGLVSPNVFNREDLSMGDHWVVLERRDADGIQFISLNTQDGARLGLHRSDLIYYGNSLRWRRGMGGAVSVSDFHDFGQRGRQLLDSLVRYDVRRRGLKTPIKYTVSIFRNEASDVALSSENRYRSHLDQRFELRVKRESVNWKSIPKREEDLEDASIETETRAAPKALSVEEH